MLVPLWSSFACFNLWCVFEFLSKTCVCASIAIFWACLVVACSRVNPRIQLLFFITWDTKADTLSVMGVGKEACLVMIIVTTLNDCFSILNFWVCKQVPRQHFHIWKMFSSPHDGVDFKNMSVCMASPRYEMCSIELCSGFQVNQSSFCDFSTYYSQYLTRFLISWAMFG